MKCCSNWVKSNAKESTSKHQISPPLVQGWVEKPPKTKNFMQIQNINPPNVCIPKMMISMKFSGFMGILRSIDY